MGLVCSRSEVSFQLSPEAVADALTSSLVAYSKIVATPTTVYLVGLAKSFASYTIHITALSATTGELLGTGHIPSSVANGMTDFFELRDVQNDQVPTRVVWIEGSSVRYFSLTPELKEKPMGLKGPVFKSIHDVGLLEHGQFVALKEDDTALVIRAVPEGFRQIWEFAESVCRGFHVPCRMLTKTCY